MRKKIDTKDVQVDGCFFNILGERVYIVQLIISFISPCINDMFADGMLQINMVIH